MEDRTPTRSQRAGSSKPYDKPSPAAATPKQDHMRAEHPRADEPGGLLRSVFQIIASPFRSTPKRRTLPPASSSSSSLNKPIDLEGGPEEEPERKRRSLARKTQSRSASPRSESESSRMGLERKRSGRFSATDAMQTGSESESEKVGESYQKAGKNRQTDTEEDRDSAEVIEMGSPPKQKDGKSQRLADGESRRGTKRGRSSPAESSDQEQDVGSSRFWKIVTDPSQAISHDQYFTLVADIKNAKNGKGQDLSDVEISALEELHDRAFRGGGSQHGNGRGMSPALGISHSGGGLFGSPIAHNKNNNLARSQSIHFAGARAASPAAPGSALNTPTRAGAGQSSIPFPSSRSAISGLPNIDSPMSTPASPGRQILGTPRRMAEKRTYAGAGRSSKNSGLSSLSGRASTSRWSEIAKGDESNKAGSPLKKTDLDQSQSGGHNVDVNMDDAWHASTSSSGSQSKTSGTPKRTQAATELLSMIDSMNAESSRKILPQPVVNPYEGGCFNIGSYEVPSGAAAGGSSSNAKPKRARLSLKKQEKPDTQADVVPVPSVPAGNPSGGVRKENMTDMELIEEADRVQKVCTTRLEDCGRSSDQRPYSPALTCATSQRSRPNPPADNPAAPKEGTVVAAIPVSTFSFGRPAPAPASGVSESLPKPSAVPSRALFGPASSAPFASDLLPGASPFKPAPPAVLSFRPTPIPTIKFGKIDSPTSTVPSPSVTALPAVPPKAQIAQMDIAALPITTFVALAQCPDLGAGFAFAVQEEVRWLDSADLPKFVFELLTGSAADLASTPEAPLPAPATGPVIPSAPVAAPSPMMGFTGWGSGTAAIKAKSAGTQWKCAVCDCTSPMDKVKCTVCEAPKPA